MESARDEYAILVGTFGFLKILTALCDTQKG